MKKNDELLQSMLDSNNDRRYPAEFSSNYDVMECLSEQKGIDTFLVTDHEGNQFVAKCYDRSLWTVSDNSSLLSKLDHPGLPKQTSAFQNENMLVTVREYIEGVPLSQYAQEQDLCEQDIVKICVELCDILAYLHHQTDPIIHRDIKPSNIIVKPNGSISLIDFDIARVYRSGHETDTVFFGTRAYAPPEQYGFSQTDARTDIYSLGILLRWLLTGNTKENKNIRIYRPLANIIRKCTGFSPDERYSDIDQVKKALLAANPRSQSLRVGGRILCAVLCIGLVIFGGYQLYRNITYTPFTKDAIPAFMSDEDRIKDAVSYMSNKYKTAMFEKTDDIALIGDLRTAMIDLYGLNKEYVYGINEDVPQENDAYFMPWGWDDGQTVDRDIAVYAAVKAHDPRIVADWSSLKDDNGYYPGVRVAVAFADETGITTGVNRPDDITLGELALILANADRVFENESNE